MPKLSTTAAAVVWPSWTAADPTCIVLVAAAICPISTAGAELATPTKWCSAIQNRRKPHCSACWARSIVLCRAVAASLPALTGARSRIESGTVVTCATLPRKREVPPPHRFALHRRRRGSSAHHRIAVGRGRQAEPLAQCLLLPVAGAKTPGALQQWHHLVDDHREIGGVDGGPQPSTVDAQPLPTQQQVNQIRCAAAEYECVRPEIGIVAKSHHHVGEDFQMGASSRMHFVDDGTYRGIICWRDEGEIATGGGEFVDARRVGQRCHHRLALGWTRGDRGPLDREVFPGEVDVMQLVPVDVAPGGHVADHRVVLPAVPKPAHHLDG